LSRSVHSRSTSIPIFSSKESWWPGAVSMISLNAAAIVASLRSMSFLIVSSVITGFLLVVVVAAPNVFVDDDAWCRRGERGSERPLLEPVLEHRLDVLPLRTERSRDAQSVSARGVHSRSSVLLRAPECSEARAVTLLGVRVPRERELDDARDVRSERRGPRDHPLRWPRCPITVRDRSVRLARNEAALRPVAPTVRRDSLAAMENFHRAYGCAHLDARTDECVMHAIETVLEDHVVVDVDAGLSPVGELVTASRQWFHRGPVDALERRASAALELLERSGVELLEQLGDRDVERVERMKRTVAQGREDPPLRDQYAPFHFGFVFRLARPRGNHGDAVVLRHLEIGGVDVRLVTVGSAYGAPVRVSRDRERADRRIVNAKIGAS